MISFENKNSNTEWIKQINLMVIIVIVHYISTIDNDNKKFGISQIQFINF